MVLRRILIRAASILAGLILALTALAAGVWLYYHPSLASVQRVTYGQRHGHEVSYDVVRPENPNGLGVALMVSGRWKSGTEGVRREFMEAIND